MKILVACEYSGRVRDAFIRVGHDAISCDLLPTESEGPHYQGDVLDILDDGWDMMIAHPPCTFLCLAGIQWLEDERYPNRKKDCREAARFFNALLDADIPEIAVENPIPHGYAQRLIGVKYSQIIEPWWFGHPFTKATCLWLKGLPRLKPTQPTEPVFSANDRNQSYAWKTTRNPKERSLTFQGVADAMANQWGEERQFFKGAPHYRQESLWAS